MRALAGKLYLGCKPVPTHTEPCEACRNLIKLGRAVKVKKLPDKSAVVIVRYALHPPAKREIYLQYPTHPDALKAARIIAGGLKLCATDETFNELVGWFESNFTGRVADELFYRRTAGDPLWKFVRWAFTAAGRLLARFRRATS